jgi:hypothetical protein
VPSLSVACATSAAGRRVATLLGQVRAVADEVLVAVDSRLDPSGLGWHGVHADEVFRFEFAEPYERVWPWLLGRCNGDWILWLDGREILSTSVVDDLPSLVGARDVVQYRLPCHYAGPRRRQATAGDPCADEPRLVRNDYTLWAPGVAGVVVEGVFPGRHLERGYYRLEKPPAGADGVRRHSIRVPWRDRRLLAAAARALTHPGELRPAPPTPLVTRAEIDRQWPERELSADACKASIVPVYELPPLAGPRVVELLVRNDGAECWPGGTRRPYVRLAHRWLREDGEAVSADWTETPLPASVDAGRGAVVPIYLAPPSEPGRYLLELDLVHGATQRFSCTTRIPTTVEPARG